MTTNPWYRRGQIAADEAAFGDCRQLPMAPAPIFSSKPWEATPNVQRARNSVVAR